MLKKLLVNYQNILSNILRKLLKRQEQLDTDLKRHISL